ncbi:MAG: preprotein translocase subunit SecG [Candidatus Vogelbacteria bacterium CG10_big_fil_rev_8_21_14_0_10_49_38]|uniref:Protein-export membrane protein SecG n=1 Tax=Candidatus Vogelbacteria bacterium CG10_big_fil_rev_8_21_14_0_10_49_38 TaxID=1975043 RepID=A0A2H0RHD1_9BACT|nr:MAG: preprotein translocase subunit SecG [bacterium CG10_49_38]PIR45908.1 MAG: preprotein translocase subunit SecG [Candidatus Vogelbacteria bacterium CG10_big_fil_rev_8_21_14_0_10_49_38]
MSSLSVLLPYAQIVLSVLLVGAILLQQSEGSLGSAFGGSQSGASGWRTKRGLEKQLFIATIVLAILFALSAALALFFQ